MGTNGLFRTAALAVLAAAAGLSAAEKAEAQAAIGWAGSARITDEDRQFKLNGRVQYDVYSIDADFTNPATADLKYSGAFARRVFLGAEGRFTKNWRYNIKFDLSPSQTNDVAAGAAASGVGNEVRLDDFFLEYAGDSFSIFVGQNNAISHMEDRTSSNETQFNERSSFDAAFGFGKLFGVAFLTNGGNWSLGAAVQTDNLSGPESTTDEEPLAYAARGTWAPLYQRTPSGISFLHLGAWARIRDNGSGASTFSYASRPGAASSAANFPNTGANTGYAAVASPPAPATPAGVSFRGETIYGAEVAYQYNSVGFAAEYAMANAEVAGAVGGERDFQGGYAEIYWSPTGEGRNYGAADGSWGRVAPLRTLGSDGGIGHVMLQLRYDFLDLKDALTYGGYQEGYLAGVTWKPIGYVKFQLNYSDFNVSRSSLAGVAQGTDGDVKAISLRTQFDF